jgi:2-dehydropantoate 2-reductase
MGYLWAKLAYGAMLFATATTNLSIAGALDAPAYRDLFTGLAKEVLCVARANGITPVGFDGFSPVGFLPDASNTDALESLTALVAFNRKSAKTHSGIWRDLSVRKRKTEVSILFPVVETGRRFGVPTPLTNRLIEMIREIEAGGREMRTENLDDLMRG